MKTQPVIAGFVARWAVTWLASKGLELNLEQAIALFGALELLITPLVWKLVTPNAKVAEKVEKRVAAEVLKRSSLPPGTVIGLVFLSSCLAPAYGCVDEAREACYAKSHADLWAAAEQQCPTRDENESPGDAWKRCEHRPRLLQEHTLAQARCP